MRTLALSLGISLALASGGTALAADKAMSSMHGAKAAATTSAVAISNFKYTPASIVVSPGTTVTWTNDGPAPHTATSNAKVWDSGRMAKGATFSHQFNTPGTFAYHCTIHPNMKGTIVVTTGPMKKAKSHM
jgi:plastocyanin